LAIVKSLDKKLDELISSFLSTGPEKSNILYFSESWLNEDMDNIHLAGFSSSNQRADPGKIAGGWVVSLLTTAGSQSVML
jgi:hypothetical protein